jgi:hypothetical protein
LVNSFEANKLPTFVPSTPSLLPTTVGSPIPQVDQNDDANVPPTLSPVEEIRYFLEYQYQGFERKGLALQAAYADQSLSPLQKIQRCCSCIAELEGIEPPKFDNPSSTGAINSIADMLCALGSEPDNFDPREYPHILSEVTEEEEEEELTQRYCLRVYTRPYEQAMEELERYLLYQPVDAGWASYRLATHGEHEKATSSITCVLSKCGFEGAEFPIPESQSARTGNMVTDAYVGTTRRSPLRRANDEEKARPQTRLKNFMSMVHTSDIKVFEILPLRRPIEDKLDFRRVRVLSDIEQVLVACTPPSLNSNPGGFIPRYKPQKALLTKCKRAMGSSPEKAIGVRDEELIRKLSNQVDEEIEYFEIMRGSGHSVGPPATPQAVSALKSHLLDRLTLINGSVSSLCLFKDITREELLNVVEPGFFSPDKGYAMSFHWHLLKITLATDGVEIDRDGGNYLSLSNLDIPAPWRGD